MQEGTNVTVPQHVKVGALVHMQQGKRRVSGTIKAAAWDGSQWLYTVDMGGYLLPRVPLSALQVDPSAYITAEEAERLARLDLPELGAA